jgi:predicted DNA-binding ArsR family transcriptional regulator
MLDRNQETRIKAQDILNHRWITGEKTKKPTKVYKASSVL